MKNEIKVVDYLNVDPKEEDINNIPWINEEMMNWGTSFLWWNKVVSDINWNTASIVVSAEQIALNVTDISDNSSAITLTAEQIALNVIDISDNSSAITLTAGEIALRVSDTDGEKASVVVSAINWWTVTIEWKNIVLDWDTTVLWTFTITAISDAGALAVKDVISSYQNSAPTIGVTTWDLWIDIDDGNKTYRYNGTAWVSVRDDGAVRSLSALNSWSRYINWLSTNDIGVAESSWSGQRVVIDQNWLRGYNATNVKTFEIDGAEWNAYFRGEVWASSFTTDWFLQAVLGDDQLLLDAGDLMFMLTNEKNNPESGTAETIKIEIDGWLPKIRFWDDGSFTGEIYWNTTTILWNTMKVFTINLFDLVAMSDSLYVAENIAVSSSSKIYSLSNDWVLDTNWLSFKNSSDMYMEDSVCRIKWYWWDIGGGWELYSDVSWDLYWRTWWISTKLN